MNWYVVTGGPCSGKTATLEALSKLGYNTVPEAARVYIDEKMKEGQVIEDIRKDEAEFQRKLFKLKIEIEEKTPKDKIVFFDRGMPDSISYYSVAGADPQEVKDFCLKNKPYRKVFFLEQLPFKEDYARTEDQETIEKLIQALKRDYIDLGYEVIDVPALSLEQRVKIILKEIQPSMVKTYAEAGVDRESRKEAKKSLKDFESTYRLSKYGEIIKTPFNVLYPIHNNMYQVKTCDGVGTKVLLAELANKHDTIGQDGIAMVVNDCIRCGAMPIAITDVIDIKKSEPELLSELQKGLILGAEQSDCPLIGGETADVPELMKSTYHINCDCVGMVDKDKIITGENIQPGNIIIGFASSGLHSNGLTLARKVLFKKWGGKYDAMEMIEGFERELIYEALEPTRIYVKPFLKLLESVSVLGAINITGDAYLKFQKLKKGIGYEFDNFNVPKIFELIKSTANIEYEEMFKTFNMGWGFAIIVQNEDVDRALESLKNEVNAEVIGKVISEEKIIVHYQKETFTL